MGWRGYCVSLKLKLDICSPLSFGKRHEPKSVSLGDLALPSSILRLHLCRQVSGRDMRPSPSPVEICLIFDHCDRRNGESDISGRR
jgi:hypothetical protein